MEQDQYIATHKDRFLAELFDLLRIPSVSTDKSYAPDVLRAAEFLKQRLIEAGADAVELCATKGYPVVYGEKIIDPALPTVLVYGHYDVQPPDPVELWESPPFEPVIRDERIYARGSCDDKGQMYMHVKAFETMMQTGTLSCNIKFMLEGEEESGSASLLDFVRQNREKLASDAMLISDTSLIANDIPSVTVGLRGMSYVEVEVTSSNRDLHSGVYGGAVVNPINALCQMITRLKDENNRITIPGFYDKVVELSAEERAKLAEAPFNEQEYMAELDLIATDGERGYSIPELTSIRPSLDVNGIWGGYTGVGAKTVIPAKAFAKISMRLVPDQTSEEITELFTKYFTQIAPKGVSVKVEYHHGGEPVVISTNSTAYRAAELAFEETFGKRPVPQRGGGSIPVVQMFTQELGVDVIMMGFGLDIDGLHSPNESYGVFNYFKGIETIPYFFQHFSQLKKAES
jgi:acetylornithine deacetylase/succinyl-diaminopimelate desuccinylase-like protein